MGRFFASPLTVENTAAVERVETEMREAMSARPPPSVCRQPLHTGQLVAVQDQVQPGRWRFRCLPARRVREYEG